MLETINECDKLVKGTTTNNIHKHVANCLGLDIYKIYCNYCDFCHVVRSTTDEHQLKTHIPDDKRTACCKDCGIAWYQGEGRLERHHPRICPAPGRGKEPRVKNLAGRNWNPEEWKFECLPNVTVSLATPFDTHPEREVPEDQLSSSEGEEDEGQDESEYKPSAYGSPSTSRSRSHSLQAEMRSRSSSRQVEDQSRSPSHQVEIQSRSPSNRLRSQSRSPSRRIEIQSQHESEPSANPSPSPTSLQVAPTAHIVPHYAEESDSHKKKREIQILIKHDWQSFLIEHSSGRSTHSNIESMLREIRRKIEQAREGTLYSYLETREHNGQIYVKLMPFTNRFFHFFANGRIEERSFHRHYENGIPKLRASLSHRTAALHGIDKEQWEEKMNRRF